jgi:hypothetical protein
MNLFNLVSHPRAQAATLRCAAVLALLLAVPAFAFPPAPHHLFYGMARDEYGSPLPVGTEIILQTSAGVQLKTQVGIHEPGINYQLEVPMDAGLTSALYQPTALKPNVPFRFLVVISGVTNLPIELKGNFALMGQPGRRTLLNLTLGEDTDGDGLPDAWERMLNADISQVNPGDDTDKDGLNNAQEYLAGTYAFDPADGFTLTITGVNQGRPVMRFLAIRGHTYTLLGTADLKTWAPVGFRIPADNGGVEVRANYPAGDVRPMEIEAETGGQTPAPTFFKLMLQ